ncbi:MAG TPA: CoB--CoM heterodisulfide reductase iron-sulfur subunit B family protein [Clostridia bacterium]|nr:CoB--CoM heterodisulfide reductase iron-sulfur subunit B family protein [Clostridia bacterium]
MKLSYYPGCSLESTAKEYDLSSRSVCRALGVELQELDDWACCGATSAHSTDRLLSMALPTKSIVTAQQSGNDVAVPCSACYNRLKKADYILRNDEKERSRLEGIHDFKFDGSVQVYSLLEALTTKLGIETITAKVKKPLKGLKVVCYYGCLLVRPPEVTNFDRAENPMVMDQLMAGLGADVKNWSCKTECCGANQGLVSGKIVGKLVGKLLDMAEEADADAVVAACPLCQANLEMRRSPDCKMPSFYFTELMGLALGLPDYDEWFKKHLVDPYPVLRAHSLVG